MKTPRALRAGLFLLFIGVCATLHAVSLTDPAPVRIAEGTKLCAQADALLAAGKAAEALAIFQEVLQFLPTSPRAKAGAEKSTATQAQTVKRARTVVVDRSHEWMFQQGGIADVLSRAGFEVIFCDASLDATVKLKDCGVLWVQQLWNAFPFSSEEITLIRGFVADGGSLVLTGMPDKPVAKVAECFGVQFKQVAAGEHLGRLRVTGSLLRQVGPSDVLLEQPESHCYLVGPPDAEALIESESGRQVAVGLPYGQGRAICFADDGNYWHFSGQKADEMPGLPNAPITAAIFRSALPPGVQLGTKPGNQTTVYGEKVLEAGPLKLVYSKTLESCVQPLIDLFPKIGAVVRRMVPTGVQYSQFTVNVQATTLCGWSGGSTIGLPVSDGSRFGTAGLVGTVAHELTHSYDRGLPAAFSEAWASYVGDAATRELGYGDAGSRQGNPADLQKAEASGRKLNILDVGVDSERFPDSKLKAYWMLDQLERKYGPDFLPRWIKLFCSHKWDKPATVRDVLDYFSKAAGEDLTPWYQSIGVTGGTP